MAMILRAMNSLKITFDDKSKEVGDSTGARFALINGLIVRALFSKIFQADVRVVLDTIKSGQESEPFTPELTQALKNLWEDPAVKTAVSRGNEYQLTESAPQ